MPVYTAYRQRRERRMKPKNHISEVVFHTVKENFLLSAALLLVIAGTIITGFFRLWPWKKSSMSFLWERLSAL